MFFYLYLHLQDIRVNAWYLFFTLSKAPELVDTMFIVLRKRKLINLHWIHHTLTLIYSWFVFGDMPSTARWMVNMNLVIHSMMYTYFALAAMRIRIPRQVNITITTLQIAQMFVGLYINIDCLQRKLTGEPADLSFAVALSGFSLYFLFFTLFVNFFIRSYIIPTSTKAMKVAVANGKNILADLNNNASGDKTVAACGEMVKKLQQSFHKILHHLTVYQVILFSSSSLSSYKYNNNNNNCKQKKMKSLNHLILNL